ncbi:hypothetical protein C2G38_615971 [Gigaspora rosea]|uniref:Uncharacterized protein n=1 Tax=Gigaspora rosea TaxID=44941 RepID=A0A397VSK8_9GLOM|nr:hypothetical protein C2G38_615971 [Gigaspora rosea]
MIVFDEFYHERSFNNGECDQCKSNNTSPAWCQTCDPPRTAQGWTSGNNGIDNYIKKIRYKTIKYDEFIEWIPFNRLKNIQKISGDLNIKFSAVWEDGIRLIFVNNRSRIPRCKVTLMTFFSSQINYADFLKNVEEYVQTANNCKLFGFTQNPSTNEYMIVFDYVRNSLNGLCSRCNRYNTSLAWCQTCDPPRISQGWTSGNKDIDDYIKRCHLKATSHEEVIEWIPFNKFKNIQLISEGNLDIGFLAVWIDGKRLVSKNDKEPIQSRMPSYTVTLKTFPGSHFDFLKNVSLKLVVFLKYIALSHSLSIIYYNSITLFLRLKNIYCQLIIVSYLELHKMNPPMNI